MAVSEEDHKLLEAFHSLTVKLKIETTKDLLSLMKHMGTEIEKNEASDAGAIPKTRSKHKYPWISTF